MITTEQTAMDIYKAAGLDMFEIECAEAYVEEDNDGEFLSTTAFTKLFDYLCFETGAMPYQVAKARTECPDEWIIDHLRVRSPGM